MENPVHLVKIPLLIVVLDAQLVTVGLADGAVLIRPGIPDVAVQVMDVVGLLLPYPQQLVNRLLKSGPSKGNDREFL